MSKFYFNIKHVVKKTITFNELISVIELLDFNVSDVQYPTIYK